MKWGYTKFGCLSQSVDFVIRLVIVLAQFPMCLHRRFITRCYRYNRNESKQIFSHSAVHLNLITKFICFFTFFFYCLLSISKSHNWLFKWINPIFRIYVSAFKLLLICLCMTGMDFKLDNFSMSWVEIERCQRCA